MRTYWSFRPAPVNTLLTAIAVIVLVGLGLWQIDRAAEKRKILGAFIAAEGAPPANLFDIIAANDSNGDIAWRRVSLSGKFNKETIFIHDNQVVRGVVGYHIIQGFMTSGHNHALLVNRGWVPAGNDRNVISSINTPAEQVNLTGKVFFPEDNRFIDETFMEQLANGMVRVQEINIDILRERSKIDFLPFIILQDADNESGFVKGWTIPEKNTARHRGYAFQWFMMALLVLTIYVSINLKRIKKRE